MNATFYTAPWRLATLYLGTMLLCVGADYYQMPDWDAGVSFLMATLTYITAPWVIHVLRNLQYRYWVLAFLVTMVTVDYSYIAYNMALGHEYFREENFNASLPLYLFMGMFWYFSEDILKAFLGGRLYGLRSGL